MNRSMHTPTPAEMPAFEAVLSPSPRGEGSALIPSDVLLLPVQALFVMKASVCPSDALSVTVVVSVVGDGTVINTVFAGASGVIVVVTVLSTPSWMLVATGALPAPAWVVIPAGVFWPPGEMLKKDEVVSWAGEELLMADWFDHECWTWTALLFVCLKTLWSGPPIIQDES